MLFKHQWMPVEITGEKKLHIKKMTHNHTFSILILKIISNWHMECCLKFVEFLRDTTEDDKNIDC